MSRLAGCARLGIVLALMTAGACEKRPAVVDAAVAPAVVATPPVRDAAPDLPRDAQADSPPDAAGQAGHRHAHRPAEPRPAPAGGFKIEGGIGRPDAETVLRGARGKLEACFQKARAQAPALAGRVTFRLSVDARGRVPLAEVVSSTLGGGDPELCMVESLRDLKFPPSAGGATSTLTFPMMFGK